MTAPDVEPYPSEMPKIRRAQEELQRRFSRAKLTDAMIDQFHRAAIDLFGEAGFEIDIAWDEVRHNGVATGMYMPEITISGRVRKESETDHDRLRHEIQAGMADGKPGVIDVNTGEWKEEPRSKRVL